MKKNFKGFTLIEALVAITILITGILSALTLVTRVLYNTSIIQDRIVASFLAQEGIELIRQKRDSNFIKKLQGDVREWTSGLEEGTYIIDVVNMDLNKVEPGNSSNLKFDNYRGYNYETGDPTTFNREITIKKINENQIRVTILMHWTSKRINYELEVEDRLFNWLGF